VGLADVLPPGQHVHRGEPLLWVHAATTADADAALAGLATLVRVVPPHEAQPVEPGPVVCERIAHASLPGALTPPDPPGPH
jgi:hypothetical protein